MTAIRFWAIRWWSAARFPTLSVPPGGHIYFTLKDPQAGISAILWASQARLLPFELKQGLEVYVTGNLRNLCTPTAPIPWSPAKLSRSASGSLQLAFEQTRQRLEAEGLFWDEHKQPLPAFPQRIGIVTSRTGAVIQDMLRVIRRKHPGMDVLLFSVKVQGDGAAEERSLAP